MMKVKFLCRVGFGLCVSLAIGAGTILPIQAFPYQDVSAESFDIEEAKWRDVIKREPKNANAYLQLGRLLESEAREGYWSDCYAAAIEVYQAGVDTVEPNAEVHFRLGQTLMTVAGDSEVCDVDDFGDAAKVRARLKIGLDHLRQAIAINPNNDAYHLALGDGLKEQGLVDAATNAYKTAVNLPYQPNQALDAFNQSMRYGLVGNDLRDQGDLKTAAAAYRKALAIEPKNSYVADQLRELEKVLKS